MGARSMANQQHLDILKLGVDVWNEWRKQHSDILPDLEDAYLSNVDLSRVDLSRTYLGNANLKNSILLEANLTEANFYKAILWGTNLSKANLNRAYLIDADLLGANLSKANLSEANFFHANLFAVDLSEADLRGADLSGTILSCANLSGADLRGADLSRVSFVITNLTKANLTNCVIYGISAWDVQLEGTIQLNLVITPPDQPTITVDNLKIAQFIYLLLNNAEIREVIDTIAKKAVLILGRFTPERKAVLDALREALRTHGYLPILFDFDKPSSQDLTETVTTLPHLSRFIIADLTDPSCIPYELHAVVPNRMVPVLPLLKASIDPSLEKPFMNLPCFAT